MSLASFRATRTVLGLKIVSLIVNSDFSAVLTDSDGDTLVVSSDFVLREKPLAGGYYMKSIDGFESFVTSDVFEEDFSPNLSSNL